MTILTQDAFLLVDLEAPLHVLNAEGDFKIQLDNAGDAWLFRDRASCLMRLISMSKLAQDLEEIRADFEKWRLQATDL